MVVVMLIVMRSMYDDARLNRMIVAGASIVFFATFALMHRPRWEMVNFYAP